MDQSPRGAHLRDTLRDGDAVLRRMNATRTDLGLLRAYQHVLWMPTKVPGTLFLKRTWTTLTMWGHSVRTQTRFKLENCNRNTESPLPFYKGAMSSGIAFADFLRVRCLHRFRFTVGRTVAVIVSASYFGREYQQNA
ncbi:unnamed protein product [Ectocarpus sp. 4 AP-2014]